VKFEFETELRGHCAFVTLRGEFDVLATVDLEPELLRLADHPTLEVVAVDLRDVDFFDSNALRAILLARKCLDEADKRLVLVRGPQLVQRMFELTRITEQLEFVDAPEHVHG
jgi:anti-anti-sigma factor